MRRAAWVSSISKIFSEKREWVLKNLAKVQERKDISDSFVPGGKSGLLLLGREYPMIKVPGQRAGFDGSSFFCSRWALGGGYGGSAQGSLPLARQELSRPQEHIELADQFGETVASVKINSARTRWGSCTSKGNINLSLFLVMAPEGAVDYCIIHELSHLKHMDHSAAFWRLVGSRCPDYEKRKEELRVLKSTPHA